MSLKDASTSNLAIASLGAALVFFFIGVTVVLAVTGSAPTAMWAAGAAVSGALVGVLVPTPSTQSSAQASALSATGAVHSVAVRAAEEKARPLPTDVRPDADEAVQTVRDMAATVQAANAVRIAGMEPADAARTAARDTGLMLRALAVGEAPGIKQDIYKAAADQAATEADSATTQGLSAADAAAVGTPRATILVLMVVFGVLIAVGVGMSFIPSEGDQLIREADKTVLALASSAGGALIGVLAPTSSKTSAG